MVRLVQVTPFPHISPGLPCHPPPAHTMQYIYSTSYILTFLCGFLYVWLTISTIVREARDGMVRQQARACLRPVNDIVNIIQRMVSPSTTMVPFVGNHETDSICAEVDKIYNMYDTYMYIILQGMKKGE